MHSQKLKIAKSLSKLSALSTKIPKRLFLTSKRSSLTKFSPTVNFSAPYKGFKIYSHIKSLKNLNSPAEAKKELPKSPKAVPTHTVLNKKLRFMLFSSLSKILLINQKLFSRYKELLLTVVVKKRKSKILWRFSKIHLIFIII